VPCYRCGRVQTDPPPGRPSPWARAVVRGEQILVCPECQSTHPAWTDELDRCPRCGNTRLSIVMGSVLCRQCGNDWPAQSAQAE
jgi:predicted amidophosphoribosyltransferase